MAHTQFAFTAVDGLDLYAQAWVPEQPKAVVVLLHGFAEHSGRYAHLARHLNEHGFAVEALDHRGHGHSGGQRAQVGSFQDYVADARQFGFQVRERSKGRPVFLMGHSMGGTISVLLALADQTVWSGLLLSSAGLKLSGVPRWQQDMVTLLARVVPDLPTIKVDSRVLSRDPDVVVDYDTDPLNYRAGARAGWSAAFAEAIGQACEGAHDLSLPLCVMCGDDDQLIDPTGSIALHAQASSVDKTLHCYASCYHELLNDLDKDQVMQDIVAWLDHHI